MWGWGTNFTTNSEISSRRGDRVDVRWSVWAA